MIVTPSWYLKSFSWYLTIMENQLSLSSWIHGKPVNEKVLSLLFAYCIIIPSTNVKWWHVLVKANNRELVFL